MSDVLFDCIASTARTTLGYVKMMLADVPDDALASGAVGLVNHPAWQVGHMTWSMNGAIALAGGTPDAALPPWSLACAMGSQPQFDRAAYPSKDAMLAALEAGVARAIDALRTADPARLAAQMPDEGFRRICPTIGSGVVFLLGGHFGMHAGHLSAWRRARGMKPMF